MSNPLSMDEFRALSAIAQARKANTQEMFKGTKLKFGTKASAKFGKTLLSEGKSVYKQSKDIHKGVDQATKAVNPQMVKKAAEQFIGDCAGVDNINDIIEIISGETVKKLVEEVTPFIGVVTSSKDAVLAIKQVISDIQNAANHAQYRTGFLPGDPLAAADAVKIIIKRDIARNTSAAARQTTVAGAKIAGIFTDLGTATNAGIGLANTLAGLMETLAMLGLEIKDMKQGNAELSNPGSIDIGVFKKSPILGCYLLTCSDTSSVANLFVADIGLPGWMDKVETLKKTKMDPLLDIANDHINSSRLQLEGIQQNKGTHAKPSFFANVRRKMIEKKRRHA